MRRDVFQAIADPTRREIIRFVSGGPMNVNAVAGKFPISRPAISKHLKILEECGLLQINRLGRQRICEAKLESLKQVSEWLSEYRMCWEGQPREAEKNLSEAKKVEQSEQGSPIYSFAALMNG